MQPNTDKQAPAAPPTLRNPGEKLPTDNQTTGVMRPVQFPKPHPDEMPGANPDEQSTTPPGRQPAARAAPAFKSAVFTNIARPAAFAARQYAISPGKIASPPAGSASRSPPANAPPAASPSK